MFFLSKCCLSQMHSLCCVSKDVDLSFLSAGLLCVWLQVSGWMMKGCTSARPQTSLEPSKLRPELVSLDWVGLSELSYLSALPNILETMAATPKLTVALKYFYILLLLFSIYVFTLPFPAEPPLLAQGTPVITTGLGQSLSIPCMLLDGIPLPERNWSQNGKAVRLFSVQIHAVHHTDNLYVPTWQSFFFPLYRFSWTGGCSWGVMAVCTLKELCQRMLGHMSALRLM